MPSFSNKREHFVFNIFLRQGGGVHLIGGGGAVSFIIIQSFIIDIMCNKGNKKRGRGQWTFKGIQSLHIDYIPLDTFIEF